MERTDPVETPRGVFRTLDDDDGRSSSEDDTEVPGTRKKRLLTENFDRIRISGERAQEAQQLDRVESVGTMKSKEGASVSQEFPPSTKKRKGLRKMASNKALRSLAELSKRFGDIQLNKDYYDSIKQTESRFEPGEDVREVDRRAFSEALTEVERLIRVQYDAIRRHDEGGSWAYESRRAGAIGLVALSLDVIHFFIVTGAMTSSTATTGLTLEHSLSKSTSQNVNTSEVIESPWKAQKHPRRSSSIQEGDGEGGVATGHRQSRQPSLVSNEPPKRQRKYDMDEVSSKPLAEGREAGVSESLFDRDPHVHKVHTTTREDRTGRDAEGLMPHAEGTKDVATVDENPSRSQTHTHASSKKYSGAEVAYTIDTVETGNDAREAPGDKRQDNQQCGGVENTVQRDEGSGDEVNEKPIWKSSLVCADLSLTEVGSKIYGPLIFSLRAAGLLRDTHRGGGEGLFHPDDEVEAFESLMKMYAATSDESQELGNMIFSVVENVYVDTYGLRKTKIAQKALALVAEAFNQIIVKDCLVLGNSEDGRGRGTEDGGEEDEADDGEDDVGHNDNSVDKGHGEEQGLDV